MRGYSDRYEGVTLGERGPPGSARARSGRRASPGCCIGPERLPDGLADSPIRGAPVGADEVLREAAMRPCVHQKNGRAKAPRRSVGALVREAPRARADRGLEDHAGRQRLPRVGAAVREEHLPRAPRRQLRARVADDAVPDERDLQGVARRASSRGRAIPRDAGSPTTRFDARDDPWCRGEGHGARVELREVAEGGDPRDHRATIRAARASGRPWSACREPTQRCAARWAPGRAARPPRPPTPP